ncbi:pheromone A receptor-domain-containing protein [Mycena rosella]|uniref:Pheromone A receptor-domain-containing protein n=1 Tax=Mycena rosella TaxID=1033263 RepID=A0AAD7GEH1_MYCRO|nr:pheromone A receptor-domain-containing protein [Mycena rosella]
MTYFYTGAPNWVFSMFAFLGFLCSSIPLPWHLEAWNTGTCLYMIWTALACLVFFINSIVWDGNMIDWAPVWCDISTHFLNGFNLAIPACSLCINRRLYQISSVRSVTKTRAEKRRAIMIDLAIGLGLPLLQIPLQYIVQGHRYNIYEDIGCLGETFETPVAIVLFHLPPLIVGLISAVYCVLSIKSFYHSRAQFKELLSSNNNLNLNRYVRLMCLASTDLFLTIPLSIWVLWVNAAVVGISPWISWEDTHSNFSRVVTVPSIFWRSDPLTVASLETTRWLTVACAFLFFGYFGFADEAIKNYRSMFFSVAKRVGYSHASMSSSGGVLSSNGSKSKYAQTSSAPGALPVFIRKETSQKRDSFDSFSDMSASFGALDYVDKEKSLHGAASFGALSLGDVSGMLPDYKEEDYSDPSSGSSSASSAGTPSRTHTPTPPAAEDEIEISSLHRSSVYIAPPAPAHIASSPAEPLPIHDAADIV